MFKKYFGSKEFELNALKVGLPIMLQGLFSSCINLIDNVMVGQFGDLAISGVAAGNRFYMIATFGMSGLLGAASIFLAQFYGAKDEEHMKQTFRYMLTSVLVLIIPVTIIGFMFPSEIIGFFTKDITTIEMGTVYLRAVIISFIPFAISLCISNAMRVTGDTKTPFIVTSIAIMTNVVGNYVFMFGFMSIPAVGVVGAAYGTVLSRLVEVTLFLATMALKPRSFATKVTAILKQDINLVKNITIKAIPLVVNEVLWSAGMATLFKFYGSRGPEVIAGYSVAGTCSDLFFTLFGGMATATTVMISHHLGAQEIEKAKENGYHMIGFSLKCGLVFACVMFASSFVFPNFYNISPEGKELTVHFIQTMSVFYLLYMANAQFYFILRAGGEMKLTFLMDSLYMWCVNIPFVALFTYFTDINIFLLYVIGQSTDIPKLVLAFMLVRKETWLKNLTQDEAVIIEEQLS